MSAALSFLLNVLMLICSVGFWNRPLLLLLLLSAASCSDLFPHANPQGDYIYRETGNRYSGDWKRGQKHGLGTLSFGLRRSRVGKYVGNFRRVSLLPSDVALYVPSCFPKIREGLFFLRVCLCC